MTRNCRIALCLAAALTVGACSTKPRQFSAQVRPMAEAPQLALARAEGNAFAECDKLVRTGRTADFASAAATGGVGVTAGLAGGFATWSSMGGASFATGSAAVSAAIPVFGLVAAFGMNRMIRGGRERGYRKHMTTCLGEMGYEVASWDRAAKKQKGTASLAPDAGRTAVATAVTAPDQSSDSDAAQAPAISPAPSR